MECGCSFVQLGAILLGMDPKHQIPYHSGTLGDSYISNCLHQRSMDMIVQHLVTKILEPFFFFFVFFIFLFLFKNFFPIQKSEMYLGL